MIYSTGNMKILIAAYIKGNPYKLLNSVDSEGKFLIFPNYYKNISADIQLNKFF